MANGERLTISAASDAIRKGELTPVEVVEQCLERIDCYEDRVRAWVSVDPDGALAEAEKLTAELKKGAWRGPLHGIPIGVKDIFDVAGWPTAAGSKVWANSIAREDCEVVWNLRTAGAIMLGKTVTTAFASFDPPVTRNPWDFDKTPGGSSSGSAAAIACGMCLGALASQTGGSITRPASYCGVCGFKPAYGKVSLHGIVPLACSMDHPGVIAGSVRDLRILYDAIHEGPVGVRPPRHIPASIDIRRVGGMFEEQADPRFNELMEEVGKRITGRPQGLDLMVLPAGFCDVTPRHHTVMAVEAAVFHEERFKKIPEDYPPRITDLLRHGINASAPDYARTKEHQKKLSAEMRQLLNGGVVLVMPATPGPAPDASTTGPPTFNSPWSYAGLPAVSFPVTTTNDGLPLCVQLVGHPDYEDHLLSLAIAFQEEVFEAGCPLANPE
jgi:Asp-tRNA(Asn)/Glu-tRNA(Gln) amidotransferase A subunit family amidase